MNLSRNFLKDPAYKQNKPTYIHTRKPQVEELGQTRGGWLQLLFFVICVTADGTGQCVTERHLVGSHHHVTDAAVVPSRK